MNMKKKGMALFLTGTFFLMLLLSGCQVGNKNIVVSGPISSRHVFQMNGMSCSLKEAKVYLTNYQNIYGTAYGMDLWEHDFGDDSLVSYVKAVTMKELTRVYCMNLLAESREMTLSEEEEQKTAEAAKEYFASLSKEEAAYLGVSESDIQKYYARYATAQKLYHSLTEGVNAEVSDDEARVMEIMQIFVTDAAKATGVLAKLNGGEDFAALANNYNELPGIQVHISRDDVPKEVEDVVFNMDNNEISGMITTDNGYYFVKCLNKYDEELTEANKSNIVEKREKEAFDDVYNEFVASLDSSVNESLWEDLELNTDETIQTGTFFAVFEKYCSDI